MNSECKAILLDNREHAKRPYRPELTLKKIRLFRDSNDCLYDIRDQKRREMYLILKT